MEEGCLSRLFYLPAEPDPEPATLDLELAEPNLELVELEYSGVPYLEVDFSNFPEWSTAINSYAKTNGFGEVLNWKSAPPRLPELGKLDDVPTTLSKEYRSKATLKAAQDRIRRENEAIEATLRREIDRYESYHMGNSFFKLLVKSTSDTIDHMRTPRDACQIMVYLNTGYIQCATNAWIEVLKIRAEHCANPFESVRKFKSAIVKLNRYRKVRLSEEQQVLQFVAATWFEFSEYMHDYISLMTAENMTLDLACKDYLKITTAIANLDHLKDLDLDKGQRYRLFEMAMDSADYEAQMTSRTSG
jgi:hypothetical protein